MIAQAHKDTVSRFSRITGCIRTSGGAEPRKAQGYIDKQHVSYESSKMPIDYKNEEPVAAIDWDEFRPTSMCRMDRQGRNGRSSWAFCCIWLVSSVYHCSCHRSSSLWV